MLRFAAFATLMTACTAPALADCKGEVEAAFEKQRTRAPGYHVTAEHSQGEGKAEISIDYVLPDRMQQKITAPNERAPIETIAVAKWAWGNMGAGWEELQPQFAQTVTAHVHEMLAEPIKAEGDYACLGKVTVDGKEYLGYRSMPRNAAQDAPKDKGPGAAAAQPEVARTVYVDPATGLPAINLISEPKEARSPCRGVSFPIRKKWPWKRRLVPRPHPHALRRKFGARDTDGFAISVDHAGN